MSREVKISLGLIAAFVAVIAMLLTRPSRESSDVQAVDKTEAEVVRPSSHRIGQVASDGKVTLVEFLDFECEACGAFFPIVEDLRQQYAGKVTFVTRYFPLQAHFNSQRAARAVEAAAAQGQFEAMYKLMFSTQSQWAEKQSPADETFRGFAQQLGLDMTKWDEAYVAPSTLDRIKLDLADGAALGVDSTPSFFLNGKRIQPRSGAELAGAIDAALAK